MDPTLPAVFSQQFNMPQASSGMFGGGQSWRNALLAAIAGFMARRSPGVAGNIINGLQDAQAMKERMAFAEQQHRQEFDDARLGHRQDRTFDAANPLPTQPDEFTRHMINAGIDPNSPQGKAMYAASLDPVVMTPQGPMLRSQLLGTGQPAPPGITFTPVDDGGPTPGASGGFL
jgi:hypothetical protein